MNKEHNPEYKHQREELKEYIKEHKDIVEEGNSFIETLKKEAKKFGHDLDGITEEDIIIPSNESAEATTMNVLVDPETGEHKIIGKAGYEPGYNFEGVIKQINDSDPDILSTKPFTEQEIIGFLQSSDDDTLVSSLGGSSLGISAKGMRELLDLVNRKLNGEKFNVYKEGPEEFKAIVDSYISFGAETNNLIINFSNINMYKKRVAESIIDEFISNIKMDRAKTDFAKELENIYNSSAVKVSEEGIEHIDQRNAAYREAALQIEDESKRSRLLEILDMIDEARNLTNLKEFAKTCKIKRYDAENPNKRIFSSFLRKYRDSVNNIYDIAFAEKVLFRHLDKEGYTKQDVDLALIAFCKQCDKYSVDNVLDHAYMYYFLYYCVMLDGDKSNKFKDNIKEVINNCKQRNNF